MTQDHALRVECKQYMRDKPLRVIFVSPLGVACGIATYAANLIDELEKQGVRVEVFSDTANFANLVKLAKESTADIVHFQHEFGISVANEAMLSLIGKFKMAGKPVVITTHTEDPLFNVLLDGIADAIILHNDASKLSTKNTFSKFYHIPHGVPDITINTPKSELRKKYGMLEDQFVIGTCGFVTNDRAIFIENLINEMASFIKEHNDFYINIATSSHRNDPDGKFASMVKSSLFMVADKYGFSDRLYVNTTFMPTDEFRERLFTFDLGFAYGNPKVESNSGAAADIVSCGTPLLVNDACHFSHIKKYCDVVGGTVKEYSERIKHLYLNRDELKILSGKAKQSKEMGYPKVAEKHIEIYKNIIEDKYFVKAPHKADMNLDKPITISLPNKFWQVLLVYHKLQPYINKGYKLKFAIQNDGLLDIGVLKYCLKGIEDIFFADVGMQHDPRIYKLHSRSMSHNLTTDLEAFFKDGHTFKDIFGFDEMLEPFEMVLGDYAEKKGLEYKGRIVVDLDTVNSPLYSWYMDKMGGIVHRNNIEFIGISSPLKRYESEGMSKEFGLKVVVEDIRTRLAICKYAKGVECAFGDIAVYSHLMNRLTSMVKMEDWHRRFFDSIPVKGEIVK